MGGGGGGWRGGIIPFLNNLKDLGGQGIVLEGKELNPITKEIPYCFKETVRTEYSECKFP